MKKTFVLLALVAVSLSSCMKEVMTPDNRPAPKTILSVGSAETKTTLGEKEAGERQLYWANDDMINVNGCNSDALTGVAASTTKTDFTFGEDLSAPYKALYPASIYKSTNIVTLPHNAGDQVIPLGGVGESTSFDLQPITAVLELKIKRAASTPDTDNIAMIEVSTTSTRMSGDFIVNSTFSGLTPTASPMGDDLSVRITGNWALGADPTSFFIPVPAGSYGFTVKVMDVNGHFMEQTTSSAKSFTTGKIKPLAAFEFVPTYTLNVVGIDTAEKLRAFATAYNNGDYSAQGADLVASLTADITFDATSSAAFNATGGIGTGDGGFIGVFDGAGHSINGLVASVPLFAKVGAAGTVKSVVMGSTSSLTHSADISADTRLGAIVGYSEGNIKDCINNAAVTCSSTTRTAGVIYMGGIVGRQNLTGTISGCENNGAVTCSTLVGTENVYVGGVVGTVERPGDSDTALISYCTNTGAIKCGVDSSDPKQKYILHMGGVVGWINASSSASCVQTTISGLVNTGDVIKTNNTATASKAVLVGGIVGGIHGTASVSTYSKKVVINDSHVLNCVIQNGAFNTAGGYGETSNTGGFVGVVRGNAGGDISFSDNCYVKNVEVLSRYGITGGFASTTVGTSLNGCNVLSSSVNGTDNMLNVGGIVGFTRGGCSLTDCMATLTKDDTHSLYGQGTSVNVGGIVGNTSSSANSFTRCKAYVSLMYVETDGTKYHGWIIGNDGVTSTVSNCGLGGTYGSGTATTTLDGDNFSTNICGNGTPTASGSYYWGAEDAPAVGSTVSIDIAQYATANGWGSPGTKNRQSIIRKAGVTMTETGSGDGNGIYSAGTGGNPNDWRFYQARGGGLTVSVPSGYSLVSATFTYTNKNGIGVMIAPDGTTTVASGSEYSLSGTSAMFTVGGSGDQVRITSIVIKYE